MSSRPSRKSAHPRAKAPEPIITRTKSAQQKRQLRTKEDKKTEKPEIIKTYIKSPKVVKTVKRPQESLLKNPIVIEPDELDQVEYYPNTLKRSVAAKKIMLKPKHNFKVIASTNKRKLSTPQKGIKSPSSNPELAQNSNSPRGSKKSNRSCSSPELSMQDMVRMMEETRSLSDEDFMEILTCPSPVWWEDPPDGGFDEDSIHTKLPEPPPKTASNANKKRKIVTDTRTSNSDIITIEQNSEQTNKVNDKNTDEKFVKKKQKLENILGNIKNKTNPIKNDEKPLDEKRKSRKLSDSEDLSDLSFNEEEILKNLEDMDIPIEQPQTESNDLQVKNETDDIEIKNEMIQNNDTPKNDNVDREILSIEIKKEMKDEFLSPVFLKDFKFDDNLDDEVSSVKTSEDVECLDSQNKSSLGNTDDLGTRFTYIGKIIKNSNTSDIVPNIKTKDLSEFITVYKITPDKLDNDNKLDNSKTIKMESVRGKLNDFFKHCKSSMRLKKIENVVPISLTDVKVESTENENKNSECKIELVDEKIRLKNVRLLC